VHILSRDVQPVVDVEHNYGMTKRHLAPFLEDLLRWATILPLVGLAVKLYLSRVRLPDIDLSQYDYIFVHDLHLLPYFESCLRSKVIFDAREYYPLQDASDKDWHRTVGKINDALCRRYLGRCRLRITVSDSIAKLYLDQYGAEFGVFRSCPDIAFPSIEEQRNSNGKINLIHHGGAIVNRQLDKLLDVAECLDPRFHLTLMLMPTQPAYLKQLKHRASKMQNVSFVDTVEFEAIMPFISQFDIGIHLLDKKGDQHEFALPNKFFEFLGAGLMLVVSGSQEMNKLVEQHQLGLSFPQLDVKAIADTINQLDEKQIARFKKQSQVARHDFTFNKEAEKLVQQIEAEFG
jgi:glycosyltransferase involved in cell wall biosynthesis